MFCKYARGRDPGPTPRGETTQWQNDCLPAYLGPGWSKGLGGFSKVPHPGGVPSPSFSGRVGGMPYSHPTSFLGTLAIDSPVGIPRGDHSQNVWGDSSVSYSQIRDAANSQVLGEGNSHMHGRDNFQMCGGGNYQMCGGDNYQMPGRDNFHVWWGQLSYALENS